MFLSCLFIAVCLFCPCTFELIPLVTGQADCYNKTFPVLLCGIGIEWRETETTKTLQKCESPGHWGVRPSWLPVGPVLKLPGPALCRPINPSQLTYCMLLVQIFTPTTTPLLDRNGFIMVVVLVVVVVVSQHRVRVGWWAAANMWCTSCLMLFVGLSI